MDLFYGVFYAITQTIGTHFVEISKKKHISFVHFKKRYNFAESS